MNFNQRNDYRVSTDLARNWWKGMPDDRFLVRVPDENNRPVNPADAKSPKEPWLILTRAYTHIAAVVAEPLTDDSGKWGLAVLWCDAEKCSPLLKALKKRKLSSSKAAAWEIGEILLQQGGQKVCIGQSSEQA